MPLTCSPMTTSFSSLGVRAKLTRRERGEGIMASRVKMAERAAGRVGMPLARANGRRLPPSPPGDSGGRQTPTPAA